jgi:hypothetical protein
MNYMNYWEREKWMADIATAKPQTFSKMVGIYNEPTKPAVRPGADDHLKHPSRMGQQLSYKDGREEKLK